MQGAFAQRAWEVWRGVSHGGTEDTEVAAQVQGAFARRAWEVWRGVSHGGTEGTESGGSGAGGFRTGLGDEGRAAWECLYYG